MRGFLPGVGQRAASGRRRRSRRSRWWRGWSSRASSSEAQARIRPALTPAQAQTSASSGSDDRGGGALAHQQVARLVPAEDGAAVVVLGDQADPGQVADQGGGDDHAVADDELAVAAGDRVRHLDDLALGALRVAEHGDVEVGGAQPGDGAGAVVRGRPRRPGAGPAAPACSQAGGTKPVTWPPCWAQSPIAWMCGSLVRSWSSTTTPRRTSSPARRASAVDGRPPAVSTTRSVSRVKPLSRTQAGVGRAGRRGRRCRRWCRAAPGRGPGSRRPAAPTWLRSRWSPPSTTSVARPRTLSARATWRPSSPPPTTTALRACGDRGVEAAAVVEACGRRAPARAAGRPSGPGRGSAAASGCCRWRAPAVVRRPGCRSASSTSRSLAVDLDDPGAEPQVDAVPATRIAEAAAGSCVPSSTADSRIRLYGGCGSSPSTVMPVGRCRRATSPVGRAGSAAIPAPTTTTRSLMRVTAAAQTLNSGIRLAGSSASLVSRLAPTQWNGTKTVSGRIVSTTRAGAFSSPRRVVTTTGSPSYGADPVGEHRVHLDERPVVGQVADPAGLGAGLVLREHPAGRQVQRGTPRRPARPGRGARPRRTGPGRPAWAKDVGEHPRRARVVGGRGTARRRRARRGSGRR